MDIYQKSIRYTANQMFRSESEALKKKLVWFLEIKFRNYRFVEPFQIRMWIYQKKINLLGR